MDRDTLLEQIPAYVLGTLEENERASIAAFIQQDAEAKAIAADYEAINDMLVFSAPARQAPAHLRDNLKHRIKQTKQQKQQSWWLMGSVAALAILLIGLSFVLALFNRPVTISPEESLYQSLASAADAIRLAITADAPTEGELLVSADGETAVLRVAQLPPLQDKQVFELWLVHGTDGVRSGGVFSFDNPQETYYIVLPLTDVLDAYNGFGLSLEDNGGSPFPDKPAGERVLGITVNEA